MVKNKTMKEVSKKRMTYSRKRGFTLIEIMVSVSVFVVIMVISMGTIVTIVDANRKSQNMRTVMDNMNFTIEAMTRTIRFGTNYHCDMDDVSPAAVTAPNDCDLSTGASSIVVRASNGDTVYYYLTGGRIARKIGIAGTPYFLTSSDVTIDKLTFWVKGSQPYSTGDLFQPKVVILVGGFSGTKPTSMSSFSMQTSVSQRAFDSQ